MKNPSIACCVWYFPPQKNISAGMRWYYGNSCRGSGEVCRLQHFVHSLYVYKNTPWHFQLHYSFIRSLLWLLNGCCRSEGKRGSSTGWWQDIWTWKNAPGPLQPPGCPGLPESNAYNLTTLNLKRCNESESWIRYFCSTRTKKWRLCHLSFREMQL